MENINSIGKRKAGSTSPPPEEPSAARQARPASSALVAPEALRRRTDAGYVAGQGGVDVAPRQGTLPPRGAHVPSGNQSEGAEPVASSRYHSQAVLERYASELQELIPLILEVKARSATPTAISKRPGMTSSFVGAFAPNGTLKPPSKHPNARSVHNKLEAIRQSHPKVAKDFDEATNPLTAPLSGLERVADDLEKLIPLILDLKTGRATLAEVCKRPGTPGSFANAFTQDGTLRPPSANTHAQGIHNKLQSIQQSHPKVFAKFKAATAPAEWPPHLNAFAKDLQKLIPLIHEVKDRRATPFEISRRPGMNRSFANAFISNGTLSTVSGNKPAQAIYNKLEAIRQSHPHVAAAFQAAMDRRRLMPGEVPAHRAAPLDVLDFGARRQELARLILQIRQHAVSLEDAELGFRGLSLLIDSSGLWRSEQELGLVFVELDSAQEQENFYRLIQEINQLLLPGALPQGESSASAALAVPADLPGSAAPLWPMFDLNVDPNLVDDAPQSPALSPVAASGRVKLEVIDRPPTVRVPLLVETPLDQARTAFYEEFEVCNLTGDAPKWTSTLAKTGGVIVHHRMQPVPGNDDKFPLRDLKNPARAHPRYAGDDGKCHRNVALKKIKLDDKEGAHKFLQELCASDPRLPLNRRQLKTALLALAADAKEEFERLIEERPHTNPRCQPRQLSAADVQDHEQVLIGQYGLFAPRPSDPAQYPTLSNGRILGFYMGTVLENEHQRQQALATHPETGLYAIEANRRPRRRRGRPNWGGAGKRTPVIYAALGSANSLAFANTALRRPDPAHPEPAYD
ncbi:MAG: hypothetical protein JF606_28905, partial [Burkholderiales bacterium]|nr:hypothetical protein [Burkholderiales bacterium]